jgi:hypothetical protein
MPAGVSAEGGPPSRVLRSVVSATRRGRGTVPALCTACVNARNFLVRAPLRAERLEQIFGAIGDGWTRLKCTGYAWALAPRPSAVREIVAQSRRIRWARAVRHETRVRPPFFLPKRTRRPRKLPNALRGRAYTDKLLLIGHGSRTSLRAVGKQGRLAGEQAYFIDLQAVVTMRR